MPTPNSCHGKLSNAAADLPDGPSLFQRRHIAPQLDLHPFHLDGTVRSKKRTGSLIHRLFSTNGIQIHHIREESRGAQRKALLPRIPIPSRDHQPFVWLNYRSSLSFRDLEDLLAERGVIVSDETIRQCSRKFGAAYARKLQRREGRLGDTWHLDELFVTIQGQRQYLWRAVDQSSIREPSLHAASSASAPTDKIATHAIRLLILYLLILVRTRF